MANNRIYIRCQACGDTLYLGSTMLDGYSFDDYRGAALSTKLNEFFSKHNYCGAEPLKSVPYDEKAFPLPSDMSCKDGAFDIVYECAIRDYKREKSEYLIEVDGCAGNCFVEMRKAINSADHVRKVTNEELFKIQQETGFVNLGLYAFYDFKDFFPGECGVYNGKVIVLE